MKKSIIASTLASYRTNLQESSGKRKERRMEKLDILDDILAVGQHSSKFINVELMDSGVVAPYKNPLVARDFIQLNKNIIEWLDGPEYDLVSY